MPQPATPIQLPFSGLNLVLGYSTQPSSTSKGDLKNVRAYDLNGVRRLSRRAGLAKWNDTDLGTLVQTMVPVTRAITSGSQDGPPADEALDLTGSTSFNLGDPWLEVEDAFLSLPAAGSGPGISASNTLSLTGNANGAAVAVCPARKSTNYVSATFPFVPQADASGGFNPNTVLGVVDGPVDGPTLCGVYIRGDIDHTDAMVLYWTRTGANTVRPRLVTAIEQTVTELWLGDAVSLSGSATPSDCVMTLEEVDSMTVRVTITWSGESVSVTQDVTTSALNDASHVRAGVCRLYASGNMSCQVSSLTVNTLGEPTPGIAATTIRYTDDNTVGSQQFFVPSGLVSVYYDQSADSVTTNTGAAQSSSVFDGVCIDTTNERIVTGTSWATIAGANGPDYAVLTFADEPEDRLAASVTPNSANDGWPLSGDAAFGVVTRISDDYKSYVKMVFQGYRFSGSKTWAIDEIDYVVVSNGTVVNSDSVLTTSNVPIIMRFDDRLEVLDPGTDGATEITLRLEGVTLFQFTIPAADIDSTNAPGLYNSGVASRRIGVGATSTAFPFEGRLELIGAGLAASGGSETSLATVTHALWASVDGDVKLISDGVVTEPSGGENAFTDASGLVQVQPAYNRVFGVDGTSTKVYDLTTNSVQDWTATAGTVPEGARLIALYRGRLVLSGVQSDPHNWYMSAAGDAFDWDFSPATATAIQAVAGNNSEVGLIGDLVTALIPYSDDVMIMGCDSSIWQMTGDPAAGGAIDLVTDQTGIVFGSAWTKDPNNTLYFVAVDGIYRLEFGTKPVNITRGVLDPVFKSIDFTTVRIEMAWDYARHGMYVMFISNNASTANTAYWWDARENAWFQDTYPAGMGPESMLAFDGPKTDDQTMLFGGRDGYIREVSDSASAGDDGTNIEATARFAPLMGEAHREIVVTSLIPVLGDDSGAVNMRLYSGQTAEGATDATEIRFARALVSGHNGTVKPRVRGAAVAVEFASDGTTAWSIESLAASFKPGGMVRRRKR